MRSLPLQRFPCIDPALDRDTHTTRFVANFPVVVRLGFLAGLWGYVTMFPGVHRINVIKHYASEYAGWERVADVLTTRRGHVCGAVVGKVYCVHGRVTYDGSKNPNDPMTFTNTMEVRACQQQGKALGPPGSCVP